MNPRVVTLAFIFDDSNVLLAMKKRRYGEGRWNGYGGKLEPGETVDDAMVREVNEESGVDVESFEKVGIINYLSDVEECPSETHIYRIIKYSGEPIETEEMAPKWFKHADIPYHDMWPGDCEWLPLIFSGKKIKGSYHFKDNDIIISSELNEVTHIN